ncbi:MAG: ribosome silencing factor [Acidobacteriota bacterium]|nr:ribosome silencing factor [Acidobacteriota bacterium]
MDTPDLMNMITSIAEEFKAIDLTVLDVRGRCDFADFFVVMSGASTTHVQSISEELYYKCKHAGEPAHSSEGMAGGEWCLLDFGNIVVHVFHPEKRRFYDLESLWQNPIGPRSAAGEAEA